MKHFDVGSVLFHLMHIYIFQLYLLLKCRKEKSGEITDSPFAKGTKPPCQVPLHGIATFVPL